jgi:alanine-glyoxylate transaminase/serine-glyoxylate transaminase/serine-pyruvate transaminase
MAAIVVDVPLRRSDDGSDVSPARQALARARQSSVGWTLAGIERRGNARVASLRAIEVHTMNPQNQLHSGRHFLQIPGPTNVPDRVLRAIDGPTIDHRGPEFAALGKTVIAGMKKVFKTAGDVVIYPSSGTGAWEAALVNTLSPGDRVLMAETGHFATLWKKLAERLGLVVEFIPGDWRHGAEAEAIAKRLAADSAHAIKAVCVVHNETSTGVTSKVADVRAAIDRVGHPALFMVDTISSLASIDYRHDEWGVDVTVGGSQKGLMLPPGLSFNAIGTKALAASKSAKLARSYWDWQEMLAVNSSGYFPYTPATNLLYGLAVALDMLFEEGLDRVFARHDRLAEATRRAVRGWGLEILCADPALYSSTLTAIVLPDGHNADALRKVILERFDMSLGQGLGRLAGKVFRIGHLGHFNDLMLCGTLAGVEMGLALARVPHRKGGTQAALDYLAETAESAFARAA